MIEQDKKDIQEAKQNVSAAIDLINGKAFGQLEIADGIKICKWLGDAVMALDDVEERNP